MQNAAHRNASGERRKTARKKGVVVKDINKANAKLYERQERERAKKVREGETCLTVVFKANDGARASKNCNDSFTLAIPFRGVEESFCCR